MADSVAAFQGWNSSIQGWDTGTWNTNVAYPVTATAAVNSAAPNIEGDAFGQAGAVVGTGAVGSVTVVGLANISVTGVAGTSTLGSFFTTNTESQIWHDKHNRSFERDVGQYNTVPRFQFYKHSSLSNF